MDKPKLIAELARAVGPEDVLHKRRDLLVYSYDAEEKGPAPDAVVFPKDAAEVSAVFKLARDNGIAIVPRGAGTNLSGGTLTVRGGIVLECSRMDRILSIDTDDQRAVVEPGVINLDLQNSLARMGYFYGPDPASQKVSTLAGNVGENAGGPHCLKYGVTSNHVLGMEVVLADGRIVDVGGAVEDIPGYDLSGLQIGAEGTLGFVTQLTLRIMRTPESVRTLLAIFDRVEDAGSTVSAIVAAGMIPATLELMDQAVIRAIEANRSFGFPLDAQAVLLIEVDGLDDGLDRQVAEIVSICERCQAREVRQANTAAERDALWAGRRGAFGAIARVKPSYIVHDGTVPRTILAEMLGKVVEIGARHNVTVANVAHAGDGNLHPLFMYDSRDADESERVHLAAQEILSACVSLGGTLTGEHGIGVSKRQAMPIQFGPAELAVMTAIKRTFDPTDIVNPGKILPDNPSVLQFVDASSKDGRGELLARLSQAEPAGDWEVIDDAAALDRYRIGGLLPIAAVRPATAAAVARAVRISAEADVSVIPWGNGARQDVGFCAPTEGLLLDLGRLDAVEEVDEGNQTIIAQAGTTLADIQGALASYRLFLPLDPDDDATVGGIIAAGLSGPRRLGYGTPRDLALGLQVVLATGDLIRVGGKTMKDVAGYDLRRLFVGSQGTLGVIVGVTFRVYPLPEASNVLVSRFQSVEQAGRAIKAIRDSQLTPVAMEVLNGVLWGNGSRPIPADESDLVLLVGTEASREAAERQGRDLLAICQEHCAVQSELLWGTEGAAVLDLRRELVQGMARTGTQVKVSLPLARAEDLFERVRGANAESPGVGLASHAGNGVSCVFFPAGANGELEGDHLGALRNLRAWAEDVGGFAIVERGSPELQKEIGTPGGRGDRDLQRELKLALDPRNLFNPGRTYEEAR